MRSRILLPAAALLLACLGAALAQPAAEAPKPNASELRKAIRAQMPPPPQGFRWEVYENVVFLKPDGWHERELPAPPSSFPMLTYGTSPGAFQGDRQPEMGLVINIFNGTKQLSGIEAKKAALIYLQPFLEARRKEDVLLLDRKATGSYEHFVFRYRAYPPGRRPVIVHIYVIANDAADSFHVMTFEAPLQNWEQNWKRFGEPMITRAQAIAPR